LYLCSKNNTDFIKKRAITTKLGYKYVKAVFQFGFTLPLNTKTIDFDYKPFLFSIGIQGFIGKKFFGKKNVL